MVFDQFEEFFTSEAVTAAEREAFYGFVVECLRGMAVQYVKVVLSLREDYRDRLRDLDGYIKAQGLATELFSQDNAYLLANFNRERARTVITALAERANYGLEPELVQALVAHLATEGGLVRPVQLQVVGAQLQAAGITTVAQYERYIGSKVTSILSSTAPVVDGYVGEVVADCGEGREQAAAWGILLGLTDAQGLRPIRKGTELGEAVACFGAYQGNEALGEADLGLVLRVLTESGLVVTWGEAEERRFQLVHDYLVLPIRGQWRDYDFGQQRELGAAQQRERLLVQENKNLEAANEVLAGASRKAGRRLALATVASGILVAGAFVYSGMRLTDAAQRETEAVQREQEATGQADRANRELGAATAEMARVQVEARQIQGTARRQVQQAAAEKAKAEQ
ncbi:MAG: hypothetical protein ACO35Q_07465, partial [Prochlorothrix sp.]